MSDAKARRAYRNQAMDRDTALNIAIDVGLLMDGKPVRLAPNGDGFDITIPAEGAPELAKALERQSAAMPRGR